MRIEETWSWDAPADRVFRMLLDPRFQDAKCAATGALSHSASVREEGRTQVVETRREMATDGLPDGVARFVGKTLQIIEIQRWDAVADDDSRSADLDLTLGGLPITFTGRIRMTPTGGSTIMHLLGDLRAQVPLVGRKIESAAAPAISGGVRIEAQTGRTYLED